MVNLKCKSSLSTSDTLHKTIFVQHLQMYLAKFQSKVLPAKSYKSSKVEIFYLFNLRK